MLFTPGSEETCTCFVVEGITLKKKASGSLAQKESELVFIKTDDSPSCGIESVLFSLFIAMNSAAALAVQ